MALKIPQRDEATAIIDIVHYAALQLMIAVFAAMASIPAEGTISFRHLAVQALIWWGAVMTTRLRSYTPPAA